MSCCKTTNDDPFPAGCLIEGTSTISVNGWSDRQRRLLITKIWEHTPLLRPFDTNPDDAPKTIPSQEIKQALFMGYPIGIYSMAGRCMVLEASNDMWDFAYRDAYCTRTGGLSTTDVYNMYAKKHASDQDIHKPRTKRDYAMPPAEEM
jgi:hypothetical protein